MIWEWWWDCHIQQAYGLITTCRHAAMDISSNEYGCRCHAHKYVGYVRYVEDKEPKNIIFFFLNIDSL